ncbi:response regulator [Sulfitobacter sp. M57]|uniref:response regulator n=1 Tax=unclassified Sulfitobacter TaxID=196795 RepID=UPI0023E239F8|nr:MULTISPECIES: response regulator [unclassified Sulfitobacter]MDF3415256.1 response regulator [Sulfitobacter sp. KE5]MDF3422737.1 response regulator [Sulfitobacter sp. KE43]MDF3433802.1 response regulator [Sulfitobacter sp. KE42]MDF3459442.1 response regulator [Sulfitobacter sp. S74]MDF3463341.1 response regulator [Sulfitobacter sp. Ks18]
MSLANKLTEERRNRLAAERMLELKKAELFAANRKLGKHAQQLSEEIVETRAQVATIRGENQRVKSDLNVANEKIAIAERRLWHSIETINDGFAFFNPDNEMIMANRAYLAIFDGLESICPGVNYVTILQVLTDEGIVNTGTLSTADWRRMMADRIQQRDPEPIVIQLWNGHFIKLVDQRGPEGDMVSLGLDITATVQYEEQLKEARSVAESASRAKSAFLANMSHEIRTPMNGVIGMADLLTDSDLDEEQKLYVETIKNSGEALLVIINDVLDYSKIEAQKLELHPQPFDLERAIVEVLMLLQTSAQDKGLPLLLDYDLFLPTVMVGDPGRVRQVMTNLIGNAIKFTTQGHVLIRVTGVPDLARDALSLRIVVEDTGIGIPEDMVAHIFGEFNQVENERNRQFDGTGLGLAISQRLVAMMGGEIWVTSEENTGSCFGFNVEMGLTEEGTLPEWSPPEGLHQAMIVDDIDVNRAILNRQLTQLGIKVVACGTVAQACARFDDQMDLLFVHQDSAPALLAHLEQLGKTLPVIVLHTHPGKALEGFDARVNDILLHPPTRQNLFQALDALTFEGPATTTPAPKRKMRILAAEDNKTNQLVFRKMVKALNLDLTFAGNGEEALHLFQEIAPDLVFMDISMPKMDGKEATSAIRARETGTRTPIIALTAHAMDGDDAGILAAGLDKYLTKPLRKPLIMQEIEAAHGGRFAPLQLDQDDG